MSKTNEEKLAEAKERVKSLVSGEKDVEIVNALIEAGAEINPKEVGETKLEPSKDGPVFECSPNSSELMGEPSKDGPVFECSPNSSVKAGNTIRRSHHERRLNEYIRQWASKSKDPRS